MTFNIGSETSLRLLDRGLDMAWRARRLNKGVGDETTLCVIGII